MEALDTLTDSQKESLQSFQAITNSEDLEGSIAILESSNWDLQSALTQVFDEGAGSSDGVPASEPEEDVDAQTEPTASSSNANALQVYSFWDLLAFPVVFPLKFLWAILRFAARLLSPTSTIPRPSGSISLENSRVATQRFIREFERTYSVTHPDFFQGSYEQALQKTKTELRYMLVYLHSNQQDATPDFCSGVLGSQELVIFLAEREIMVWAADVHTSHGYQTGVTLGATRFPFLALVAPNGVTVPIDVDGSTSSDRVIASIIDIIDRIDPELASARADRRERELARSIREQQDAAYQASLAADREKARRVREEQARAERERQIAERIAAERERKIERRKQRRREIIASMEPEPDQKSSSGPLASVLVRLPNGGRAVRRFKHDDPLQKVYDFVETQDLTPFDDTIDIVLVNTYPRKLLTDLRMSCKEAGLVPNGSLVVEEKLQEEGDTNSSI
ncbi:FAS-associated factor 2 [Gaertneriomyces sp. JEL0708]|nr:FAS-associated factor 2 [Gaertneriomyces sp. JEL0708]